MVIGDILKKHIKQKGYTAKEFASMIGVSEPMVYKYYKMDNVDFSSLKKWSEALGVPISEFINDGNVPDTTDPVYIQQRPNGTPYYDIDATCGHQNRDIDFATENIVGYIDLPYINKESKIIRANGDSMEPRIHNGDMVVIREIHDWSDVFYGQIYLVLMDEYRMIKYIRKYEEDEENFVILRSENENYDDIKLHRSKIRKLFIVEHIISLKAQL